jgi:RND family efflux transporter MFP subunit
MKTKFYLFTAVSTLTVGLLTAGCSPKTAQQGSPAQSVTVAAVEEKEIVEWSEFTGHAEPVDSVEIRPRTSGYIQEVRFQSGQLVKKGDVLFVIDPRWSKAVFDQREAEYNQAKSESDRTDKLLANNAISAEEAEARKARSEVAKAALDSARLDLEYTEVKSPIDGRVSRALLTEGNYVSGNAGSASLLTTIVSVGSIYVYADIDEDTLLKFNELVDAKKLGVSDGGKIPVELQLADESEFPHQGYIESFDNKLDPATGSILLRAVFPNYQAVKLGPLIDGQRVIRSGLDAGEQIVMNGLARVRPGMPVTPEEQIAKSEGLKIAQK